MSSNGRMPRQHTIRTRCLNQGRKIRSQEPGYDTDKEILQEPKDTAAAPLRTKDVRGPGEKTIAREFELDFADQLYSKKDKKTKTGELVPL